MERVVILGAGFAGLELATRLSDEVADEVEVVLIDAADAFVFGYSKLDVMYGRQTRQAVRMSYSDIDKPSVTFKQESVTAIDPERRTVTTDRATYDADVLVVALGADIVPARTPGLVEGGNEFYTVAGAERLREVIPRFDRGDAIVSVLGPFFKCPAAPYECAMMLHDHLESRGVRGATTIKVLTPMGMPIPISKEASGGILGALAARGIEFCPETVVTALDPATHTATLRDGRTLNYDLFLGVPVHEAPPVVVESGLTVDGWIPVDPKTFATRFPNVYAVGDITSAPVPRVGVIAEGEAGTVADVLVHRLKGGDEPPPYPGIATCYIEFGGAEVAKFEVNFLGGPTPTGVFLEPSLELAESKKDFGATRRRRWFNTD
ncbi:MAG TPA: FAD-dependent oxidoreductase [Acidimicrobiia bacterium]|jgi:sulfide:quinone oxidoreductase|nr:FAD-dependent oxidoreductase [Acidimicrobiia bacterium]